MLTKNQEKIIKALATKKGRETHGLCLVEGSKVVELAGGFIEYSFGPKDSSRFETLVTTETPQSHAAVARIPMWNIKDIMKKDIIVLLDGVQDPGNVGAAFRLCLGFGTSIILVESADPASPKVIRSSVGAMFQVPWIQIQRKDICRTVDRMRRFVIRLEKRKGAIDISGTRITLPIVLIVGSEGGGIREDIPGTSVYIKHHSSLESLNATHALAIALYALRHTI